jgi:hypothetical protein
MDDSNSTVARHAWEPREEVAREEVSDMEEVTQSP